MKEIINCAAYQNGRRIADVELNRVHEVLEDINQFVWIGLHEPSEEVLQRVQEEFNLHDLAIEDAHNAHQRPKIELYGETVFIVLRTAYRIWRNPHFCRQKLYRKCTAWIYCGLYGSTFPM